ncbi:MAG TPA: glycerophosphoryl diester phosphodiesterase membrane domain-containing protein [SAR202 cluster bacterium]|jgi:hypothetical protein|nr:glycerophosphoryl diester phosphodiesterase membrane domain-containing protein [SAR202 cluster bacterium]|tara:strand:+ start:26956 stop:27987 length:1032 start_codon:yes stop_codon:yes gene_type:complete
MGGCKNCDFENTESSLFCGGCGKEIATQCERCRTINRNQTFCTNCGQVLSHDLGEIYNPGAVDESENEKSKTDIPSPSVARLIPEPGKLVDLISISSYAYRKNFKNFLILSLINGIPVLVIGIILRTALETDWVSLANFQPYNDGQLSENLMSDLKSIPIWKLFSIFILILIGLVANLISVMAIIVGAAQFANSEKVSSIACLNYTLSKIGRLILLSLFLIGLLIIPFLLSIMLIGIPILLYLFVRWYFSLPSMALDNTGITRSIQMSWDLVEKRWWVTFGTGLVIVILMTIPTYLLNLLSPNLNSDFIILLIDVCVTTLVSPFQAIATGLYFLSLKKFPKEQ